MEALFFFWYSKGILFVNGLNLLKKSNSIKNLLTKDDRAAVQAEIDTMMGLDGSVGEWYDTHKVK